MRRATLLLMIGLLLTSASCGKKEKKRADFAWKNLKQVRFTLDYRYHMEMQVPKDHSATYKSYKAVYIANKMRLEVSRATGIGGVPKSLDDALKWHRRKSDLKLLKKEKLKDGFMAASLDSDKTVRYERWKKYDTHNWANCKIHHIGLAEKQYGAAFAGFEKICGSIVNPYDKK